MIGGEISRLSWLWIKIKCKSHLGKAMAEACPSSMFFEIFVILTKQELIPAWFLHSAAPSPGALASV